MDWTSIVFFSISGLAIASMLIAFGAKLAGLKRAWWSRTAVLLDGSMKPLFYENVSRWEILEEGSLEVYGPDDDGIEIKLFSVSPRMWNSITWHGARTEFPKHIHREDLHA